ncbi:hypothetical protein SDC9_125471 [bioreactor metagenome]|uniref:Uncharacterized protein n=1 Tax=bioreactor metagenome TaxID=1076179 RepID=A0A645CN34_9ZZZZ
MTAAISLSLLAVLIPGSMGQLLRFLFRQAVQGFFHTVANQFFQVVLDYSLVQLYDYRRHSGSLLCRIVVSATPILPSDCLLCLFLFAKLIVPYPAKAKKTIGYNNGHAKTLFSTGPIFDTAKNREVHHAQEKS